MTQQHLNALDSNNVFIMRDDIESHFSLNKYSNEIKQGRFEFFFFQILLLLTTKKKQQRTKKNANKTQFQFIEG